MRRLLKGAAVSFVSAAAFFVFFTAAAGTRIVPPYLFALAYGFAGRIRAVGAAAGGGGLGYLLPLGGDMPGQAPEEAQASEADCPDRRPRPRPEAARRPRRHRARRNWQRRQAPWRELSEPAAGGSASFWRYPPGWRRSSRRTYRSPPCGIPQPGPAGRRRAGGCPCCSSSMASMWSIQ